MGGSVVREVLQAELGGPLICGSSRSNDSSGTVLVVVVRRDGSATVVGSGTGRDGDGGGYLHPHPHLHVFFLSSKLHRLKSNAR